MNTDTVIVKAKRLVALRDRAGSEHEAMAAAKALASLLEKHRLSMAEVEASGDDPEEGFTLVDKPLASYMRMPAWKRDLVAALCLHFGVATWERRHLVGYDRRGREKWRAKMMMCGRPSDVVMLRFMYGWVSAEATRLVAQVGTSGSSRRYRNSWLSGFVMGIYVQLKESREKAAEQASQEAGLVLQRRYDAAMAFLDGEKPDMEDATKRKAKDLDVLAAAIGFERGKSHHLGDSLPERVEGDKPKGLLPSASDG